MTSDVEVTAKSTVKELKIAQENVGFESATFPLPTMSLQNHLQGSSIHLGIAKTVYEQTLEV